MKRLLLSLIILGVLVGFSPPARSQNATSQTGSMTTAGTTTDCATAGTCVVLVISGPATQGSASIWLTGTWSATVQFEVTSDNNPTNSSTWVSVSGFPSSSTTGATNTTSNGLWVFNAANVTGIRTRVSNFASGTVNSIIRVSTASASKGGGGGAAGGVGIFTVATLPAGLGAGGTGTLATVKDGSTTSDCTTGLGSSAVTCIWTGSAWAFAGSAASAPAFSAITTGSNITATMTCGAGCTITTTSTGVNNANQVNGGVVPTTAPLLGTNASKQPISVTTIPTSTVPAFTGDMTNSAGSLATTVGQINGGAMPSTAKILGSNASSQPIAAALGPTHIYVGSAGSLPADVALSGDSSITSAGIMTNSGLNGGAVPTSAKVLGTDGTAKPIATVLNSAHLFVGNGSNLPADVALSGDIGITNAGLSTVTAFNGGTVPTSASVLGTDGSAKPVAVTAHGITLALKCADSSGSGSAQSCTTTPSFTPAYGDCIIYTTTTGNTGDVTINVNSTSALHVLKWLGSSALSASDLAAQQPVKLCLDNGVNINSVQSWEIDTIGNPPAGTGGTINNANQFGGVYYTSPPSGNTLSGFAPPVTQGFFNYTWSNSSNASSAPQPTQVGLNGRALITGTTTTTVLYSDVNSVIDHDDLGTQPVTVALPTPVLLNNAAFAFRYSNHSGQSDIVDPHTTYGSTIQKGTAAAANTMVVSSGESCLVKVDPASSTNWLADCTPNTGLSGTVPNGTLGLDLTNFNGINTYKATSTKFYDATAFCPSNSFSAGSCSTGDMGQAIAAAATAAGSTSAVIDAKGFFGNQLIPAGHFTTMLSGCTNGCLLLLGTVRIYVDGPTLNLTDGTNYSFNDGNTCGGNPAGSCPGTPALILPTQTRILGPIPRPGGGKGANISWCTGPNLPAVSFNGNGGAQCSMPYPKRSWPVTSITGCTGSTSHACTVNVTIASGKSCGAGGCAPNDGKSITTVDINDAIGGYISGATNPNNNFAFEVNSAGSNSINVQAAVPDAQPVACASNCGTLYLMTPLIGVGNTAGGSYTTTCSGAAVGPPACSLAYGTRVENLGFTGAFPNVYYDGVAGYENKFGQERNTFDQISCFNMPWCFIVRGLSQNSGPYNNIEHLFGNGGFSDCGGHVTGWIESRGTAVRVTEGSTSNASGCVQPPWAPWVIDSNNSDARNLFTQGTIDGVLVGSQIMSSGVKLASISCGFGGTAGLGSCTRSLEISNTFPTSDVVGSGMWNEEVNTGAFTVASAAANSGGTTVYTGTFTGGCGTLVCSGAANAFANIYFTISGFTTHGAQNNGTFLATASSATTLTLLNPAGLVDSSGGTATQAYSNVLNDVTVHDTGSAGDSLLADYSFDKNGSLITEIGSFTNFKPNFGGGLNVPSGATLNIASGGTLNCAAGSTCPSGGGGDTITSPNSTLNVGGTSSATTLDFNLTNPNSWTGLQTFGAHAAIGTTAHGPLISENASASVAAAAGTSGQVFTSGGASADGLYSDYYHPYELIAVNQNAGVVGNFWSLPASNACTATAKTGTNVLDGTLTCTTSQSAQAKVVLTAWDATTPVNPFVRFIVTSTDTTNGHTIIPTVQASCSKGDGTATYDNAFQAAQSGSTVTFGASEVASAPITSSTVQLNSTSMTNCIKGSVLYLKFSFSGSSTATDLEYYGARVTVPELNTAGAQ